MPVFSSYGSLVQIRPTVLFNKATSDAINVLLSSPPHLRRSLFTTGQI
jgi:hypothetical protein